MLKKNLIFIILVASVCRLCAQQPPRIEPLSDALMAEMRKGGSWKADTPASLRGELRLVHLRYRDADDVERQGRMIVNRRIAQDVVEIFDSLCRAHYRIARIALVDEYGADDERSMQANNTSAFNYRRMAGSQKALSLHARGLAIDLNPLWNPYVKGNVVRPRGALRRPAINHSDLAYKLFTAHGFRWGGDWKSLKDYQHFER